MDIEVDGGINAETARVSIENGANVLVAGTSIFHAKDYAEAIRERYRFYSFGDCMFIGAHV